MGSVAAHNLYSFALPWYYIGLLWIEWRTELFYIIGNTFTPPRPAEESVVGVECLIPNGNEF